MSAPTAEQGPGGLPVPEAGERVVPALDVVVPVYNDVVRELLPLVEDTSWFFDTELLVLAERAGLRIHEVPVDWVDDPDSRVDVWRTARDDLRGISRRGWAMLRGTVPLAEVARRLDRKSDEGGAGSVGTQVALFAIIGVFSTVACAVLYLLLRTVASPWWANAAVLVLTAVANTAANRRLTFGVRGREHALRHRAQTWRSSRSGSA